MASRERRALGELVLAFGPYALFHLLLQETATLRYALPILPGTQWLAARGAVRGWALRRSRSASCSPHRRPSSR